MFLDYYIPNRLVEVRDDIVLQYLEDNKDPPPKPKQHELMVNAVSCMVYNISYCIATGDNEFTATLNSTDFSKPLVYNGVIVNRKVSYVWFRRIVDWMVDSGSIALSVGGVEAYKQVGGRVVPSKTRNTVISLSEAVVEALRPVSSSNDLEELANVLELRGEGGNSVPYKTKDFHIKLIEMLDAFNSNLVDAKISVGDKDYRVQSKKVYSETFLRGGRVYLTGSSIMTGLLRKTNRSKIMINDEKTCHLDFCNLHPAIIAELEGVQFPEDFSPYEIELEGYDKECLRKIAKLATLLLINSKSPRQAAMALSYEMFNKLPLKEWKDKRLVPDPVGSKLVIRTVMEHNAYANGWYGEHRGLELQNIDSKIMDGIIERCLQEGLVIIPIHDSVVVAEKHKERARQIMVDAYNSVLRSTMNCKIKED